MKFKHKISEAEKPFNLENSAKNDVEKVNKNTVKAISLKKISQWRKRPLN